MSLCLQMQFEPLPAGDQNSSEIHSHLTSVGFVKLPRQRELAPQMLEHDGANVKTVIRRYESTQ